MDTKFQASFWLQSEDVEIDVVEYAQASGGLGFDGSYHCFGKTKATSSFAYDSPRAPYVLLWLSQHTHPYAVPLLLGFACGRAVVWYGRGVRVRRA